MCCFRGFGRGFFAIGVGRLPACLTRCGGVNAVYDGCCRKPCRDHDPCDC